MTEKKPTKKKPNVRKASIRLGNKNKNGEFNTWETKTGWFWSFIDDEYELTYTGDPLMSETKSIYLFRQNGGQMHEY